MTLWFAALLGLIQGLTEFLPISSTAHLRIAPALFGQPDPGAAFSAVIQLGTLLAVVSYFARDLFIKMPRALLSDPRSTDGRMAIYICAGTVPIVILGLSLKEFITTEARSLYVVSGALIAVGAVMLIADRVGRRERELHSMVLFDALIIGLAQACALVPGVSRSGSTIIAALFLGLRRSDAARFSFLLGVPAIAGAGVFEVKDAVSALGEGAWPPILVGTAVSAVAGYASIAWLLRYLARNTLRPFGFYRVAAGGAILALTWAGTLAAVG